MLIQLLLLIPIGFLFRAFYFEKRRRYIEKVHTLHLDYCSHLAKKDPSPEAMTTQRDYYQKLLDNQEITKIYLLEAGIGNPKVTRVKPLGLGAVETPSYAVFDNITHNNIEFADLFYQACKRAIGFYKHNRNESLNPLCWPEYIVLKLPKSLLTKTIEIVKSSFSK